MLVDLLVAYPAYDRFAEDVLEVSLSTRLGFCEHGDHIVHRVERVLEAHAPLLPLYEEDGFDPFDPASQEDDVPGDPFGVDLSRPIDMEPPYWELPDDEPAIDTDTIEARVDQEFGRFAAKWSRMILEDV